MQSLRHSEGDDSLALGVDLDSYIDEVTMHHDRSGGGKGLGIADASHEDA